MSSENIEPPQLEVQTENVRRSSIQSSNAASSKIPVENVNLETVLVQKPSLDPNEKSELSHKRTDSDSKKFGAMENISLDLSIHEANAKNAEKSEPPQDGGNGKQETAEGLSLSQYFGSDPSEQGKGSEFFDNILKSSSDKKDTVEASPLKATENSGIISKEKPVDATPSNLLQFFNTDSTTSADKNFFDEISQSPYTMPQPITSSTLHDDFLSSPSVNSEIHESWIPSLETRQILMSVNTSSSPIVLERSQMTLPSILVTEEMRDSVKELLLECNSPQASQRTVLTENNVSPDETGLQKLMEAGCYKAAINLTQRLLKPFDQTPDNQPIRCTPFSIRLWYVRLALFVRLKLFRFAEKEVAAFGNFDKPDLYYEYYPVLHKGKKGTFIPFPFRLLAAELPQHLEKPQVALDNLYNLLHVIQKIIRNLNNGYAEDGSMIELGESRKTASLEVWSKREKRVLYSILNCLMLQKNFPSAVSVTRKLIAQSEDELPPLYSALGRIYLQLGDVKVAQECFEQAAVEAKKNPDKFVVEEKINSALLAMSQNENEEALKYYGEARSMSPQNAMLVNNMAVCLLYLGRLREALDLLEETIKAKPSTSLHEGLLFNICTLYELESSKCSNKKIGMLELVAKHVGDSFNVACLKIQAVKA